MLGASRWGFLALLAAALAAGPAAAHRCIGANNIIGTTDTLAYGFGDSEPRAPAEPGAVMFTLIGPKGTHFEPAITKAGHPHPCLLELIPKAEITYDNTSPPTLVGPLAAEAIRYEPSINRGEVYLVKFPPGAYEIQLMITDGIEGQVYHRAIPFTIASGRTVYLGEYVFMPIRRKEKGPWGRPLWEWRAVVSDRLDRDLGVLRRKEAPIGEVADKVPDADHLRDVYIASKP
jgi:hypothetical protein